NYTGSYPLTIRFISQNIYSSKFNLSPANATLILNDTCTTSTTFFNGTEWVTTAPPNLAGEYFISGYSFSVRALIYRNLNPVKWKGIWSSSACVNSVEWKWAASVYTNFSTSLNTLG